MSVLQQVYCTHCTYGSSALERRGGAAASQVLGYSARASSYEQADLKTVYRAVEFLLQYSLPPDVPAAERQLRTPQDSPRRLVYMPAIAGWRWGAKEPAGTRGTVREPAPAVGRRHRHTGPGAPGLAGRGAGERGRRRRPHRPDAGRPSR